MAAQIYVLLRRLHYMVPPLVTHFKMFKIKHDLYFYILSSQTWSLFGYELDYCNWQTLWEHGNKLLKNNAKPETLHFMLSTGTI